MLKTYWILELIVIGMCLSIGFYLGRDTYPVEQRVQTLFVYDLYKKCENMGGELTSKDYGEGNVAITCVKILNFNQK